MIDTDHKHAHLARAYEAGVYANAYDGLSFPESLDKWREETAIVGSSPSQSEVEAFRIGYWASFETSEIPERERSYWDRAMAHVGHILIALGYIDEVPGGYQLTLTEEDVKTIQFIGSRYQWTETFLPLGAGTHRIPEHEVWGFGDVVSEAIGSGEDPFPMLDDKSNLYAKLLALYESII